ncbi:MAG: helix-turn-helix domain-containing protein, partial [bacterium]
DVVLPLARRPILFSIARALAEGWPGDVPREKLMDRAFGGRVGGDSYRLRLRVEIARLRSKLKGWATLEATERGFRLAAPKGREFAVLARPIDEPHASVLALLEDGEAWSSSALSLALDASQREVQRRLDSLAKAGKIQAIGLGRSRRWTTPPLPGITLLLSLSNPLPAP